MKRINYFKMAFLWIGVCLFAACSDDTIESTVDTKEWDIDSSIDASYAPGDDFFMYCNGTWYNNVNMGDKEIIGTHLRDKSEYHKRMDALRNEPMFKKIEADILSIDQTTEYAYASISKNIEEVPASISTKEDAWIAVSKAMQKGYQPFFKFFFYALDGELYGIVTPSNEIKIETAQAVKHVLIKAGLDADRSAKDAEAVVAMQKKLYNAAYNHDLSPENLVKHPELCEQLVKLSSVKTRSDNDHVLSFVLKQLGIDENYIVLFPELERFFEDLKQLHPDIIESYLTYSIAKDSWMASHQDMVEYNAAFGTNFTLNTIRETMDKELNYPRSYAFATKFMPAQLKAQWMGICEELRLVFKDRIKKLDWMSPTTKERAIEKLEAMTMGIGYPNHWITEGFPALDNCKSLVEDMMQARQANYNLMKFFIGKKAKDEGFNLLIALYDDLTTVNAFYDPILNSLFIYPAVMLPPVYDEKMSDATMYACASVIAHEMVHGFDSYGSQYDKLGNYKNWWTVSDQMEFLAKQQLLIDCYNRLEILPNELPGEYADGANTLGENIADLGGMQIAHQSYMAKLKQQGYVGDELIKQEKRFFHAYADFWKSRYTPNYALDMRKIDTHSLAKERINGVVMNFDRWYELYDVKWGNRLYLKPEKRSYIW